ncbi:hypothetical protein SLS60_000394 [Paraconiothyrium brasiliense]|uniref:Uncharacterized protein n=1 Tax=Paraconiothyrium brasiliense TaxID=300254 RepID=A0ABR3S648_9PLEO
MPHAPDVMPAQQPPSGMTAAFVQQNHAKRPTLNMSDATSAASYLSSGATAPMRLDRRPAFQPPTVPPPVPRGVYAPSSYGASMLGGPGVRPAIHATPAVNSKFGPCHQEQTSAGSSGMRHPVLHAQTRQTSTASQSPRYQPNPKRKQWFDTAAYQLQNPYRCVPGIPPSSQTPTRGALLYPYQVLGLRFLPPKERYKKYAEYHGLLASIYGPSINKTSQAINILSTRLNQLSAFLIHTEQRQEQDWQKLGRLQDAKEHSWRAYTLAELGLGTADLPVLVSKPASVDPQVSNTSSVSRSPAIFGQQNTHGSAPQLYMPNLNKVPPQATSGRYNGNPTGFPLRGDSWEPQGLSNPGSNPRATSTIGQAYNQAQGPSYQSQIPSTGYRARPADIPMAGAVEQVKQLPVQNQQQAGGSSSVPIVIEDDNEPQQAAVIQRSPGLSPALKRGPSAEVISPRKAPRTDSYTKPVDLTEDNGEEAAVSPATQAPISGIQAPYAPSQGYPAASQVSPSATHGPPPVRKTFEGSEDFQQYEAFRKEFEAKKQKVQNAMPGHLNPSLATENNRGLYKHNKPWMAFNASRQREIDAKEEAKRQAEKTEERLKARRKQEAARKREKRQSEQAEKQKVAAQKARREQRRREAARAKEEAEAAEAANRKKAAEGMAAKAKQQQEELEAATLRQQAQAPPETEHIVDEDTLADIDDEDENDELGQAIIGLMDQSDEEEEQAEASRDAQITTKEALDDNSHEDAPLQSSIDMPSEVVPGHDDLADLFEEQVEDASTSPNGLSTENISADDDDMRSLFSDDEVDSETPITSPEDSLVLEQADTSNTSATTTSANTGFTLQEKTQIDAPVNEQDPRFVANRLQIQVLEKEIEEKTARLSTSTNGLYKKRIEAIIKRLNEEKILLEIEFADEI